MSDDQSKPAKQYEIHSAGPPWLRLADRLGVGQWTPLAFEALPFRATFATVGDAASWLAERGKDPADFSIVEATP